MAGLSVQQFTNRLRIEKSIIMREKILTIKKKSKEFESLLRKNTSACASADLDRDQASIHSTYLTQLQSLSHQKSRLDIKISLSKLIFMEFLINLAIKETDPAIQNQIWSFIENV
jgi:hypothetical protein